MLLQSLSLTKFIYIDLAASNKYHQALPSLYIQTWQLGELFMVPIPKQLAVSATGATPAHKDPPTRPPYRTVYGQSAQKALTTAMMADDPDE